MVEKLTEYRKALLGFITPGAVIVGADVAASGWPPGPETWVAAVVAMIVTGGAVAAISNSPSGSQKAELERAYQDGQDDALDEDQGADLPAHPDLVP